MRFRHTTGVLLLASACTGSIGSIGDGPAGGGTTIEPPPTSLPIVNLCTADRSTPGPAQVRRLSAVEFNRTLVDLFRDSTVPQATFFNDPKVLGFQVDSNALLIPDSAAAQQILAFSEDVASWVDDRPSSVVPCTTTDTACAKQFVRAFGKRAFRAPLTEEQATRYDRMFAAQPSFQDGVHQVVRGMLMSPSFLFRQEIGTPDTGDPSRLRLTPYEVASNLSYLILGSMPDDALFAAADAGALQTRDQLDQQVTRLLGVAAARDAVMRFMDGWLDLDRVRSAVKDQAVFPIDDALRASMYAESRALVLDKVFGRGTLADLLTADHTFVDQRLAQFYGLPGEGRVTLTGQRDRGLLANATLMTAFASADSSSPVQRGKLIRTRLLCETLPPPPADLATELALPTGEPQTTRQRFEQHDRVAPCNACHTRIDPIGFAFEQYDGIGRFRTQENGFTVDTSGEIVGGGPGGASVPLAGLSDLTAFLAGSTQVQACMVRFWSYYAFGAASWEQDGCTQDAILEDAVANGFTLESVLRAIVHAPHFSTRVPAP
jgi:hypothetical protein